MGLVKRVSCENILGIYSPQCRTAPGTPASPVKQKPLPAFYGLACVAQTGISKNIFPEYSAKFTVLSTIKSLIGVKIQKK